MPDDLTPPRAPDLETLLNIEGALEPAIGSLLESESEIEQIALSRGVEIITSRRIDVELTLGRATGALYVPRNLPADESRTDCLFERAWEAQLALSIVTNRDENGQFHALYRARVRALMMRYTTLFLPSLLPFHALTSVRSTGTRPGLLTKDDEDYSCLTFSCLISIRNTAWPDPY